jgi:hypothetical protein
MSLYYSASDRFTFNVAYTPLPESTAATWYRHVEPETGRRYNLADMTAPGGASPEKRNPHYEFLGVKRYWRYSEERMRHLLEQGLVVQTKPGNVPQLKRYLDESKGVPLQDVWTDIPMVRGRGPERRGYPTQKPVALLERIINLSSNAGDVVLDPFCGCGTVFEATRRTRRRRIGIDISDFAVKVIRERMAEEGEDIEVFDWPTEMDGVRRMVDSDRTRRRFEDWALARLGLPTNRRGGDGGVDGKVTFTSRGKQLHVIVSVKSAKPRPSEVRDLLGTMHRERAVMGLLFTLEQPTALAWQEIHAAGRYRAPDGTEYPKIVVHQVEDLLVHGRLPDLPSKHGIQEPLWPIPASTRSVRLRTPSARLSRRAAQDDHATAPPPVAAVDVLERVRSAHARRLADRDAPAATEPIEGSTKARRLRNTTAG